MLQTPQIILASASPRREILLRELGLPFRIIKPDGVEEIMHGFAPHVLAMRNAQLKAAAIAAHHRETFVIGADTIVVLNDVVYGKPKDMAEAEDFLSRLAGRCHEVYTGVCVVHRVLDTEITFAESTRVWMHPLTLEQIRDYFTKVNPLDKAGAYGAQEHGELIIARIEGSFSNVMGLPMERLRGTFEKLGMVGEA